MDNTTKSILQMARGAITERADYEMARIIGNIMDANTKATAKRKLTLTLELVPDDERRNISVSVTAKSTLGGDQPGNDLAVHRRSGCGTRRTGRGVPAAGARSVRHGRRRGRSTRNPQDR